MAKWFEKRLDEIAEFNPRESLKKGSIAKKISMDKLQPFCRDVPGFELEPYSGGTKFRNGDTIMARITPCLENGKTAKVSVLENGEVGFGSTEYIVFRAKDGCDSDFLYYLVTSSIVRGPAIKSMVGSSGRQRVQTDVLQTLMVKVPDLETQQSISGILKSLDDKIAANRKINDNLEATIQAAFDKAFHDAGVSLPETIIKQNKVPQGWTDATVGDFASVQTGPFGSQLHNEDYVESGTPIITVEHMDGKYIAHRNLPLVSQNDVDRLRKYDLHTGDIVFSRVGSVDRAVMVSQHEDGWLFSGRCLRVRPYDPNTGSYFLWWFNQPVIRQLVTASAVGATMPSINTSILNSIRIVFPQKDIVTQFCKMADGLIEIIATNLEEIRKLNDAREYIQLSLSR